MVGLHGRVFNLQTIYNFKIKLLYNKENVFCTKTEFLNFKIAFPLAKLDMFGSRLVSNRLIFSDVIPVDIQLVTFLLLSNIREESIGVKTRNFWSPSLPAKYILPNKKSYPFYDICATLFVKSFILFSASTCFILFKVHFLFTFFSLSSKSVFFTNLAISFLLAKFACARVLLLQLNFPTLIYYILE